MSELLAGPALEESRDFRSRRCFQKRLGQNTLTLQGLLQTGLHGATGDALLPWLDDAPFIPGAHNSRVPKTGREFRLSNPAVCRMGCFHLKHGSCNQVAASLLQDFENGPFAKLGGCRVDDGPEGVSVSTFLADDFSKITLCSPQFNDRNLMPHNFFDLNFIRKFCQSLGNHLHEFFNLDIFFHATTPLHSI